MSLRLTNKAVAGVQMASQVLLSPFSYEDGEAWRRAACKVVEKLLEGNGSSFALPIEGEPLIGGAPDIVRALQVLVPPPAWLVHAITVRRRELGLSVADWTEIHDVPAVKRTSFYNDVVRPNRFMAPVVATTDVEGTEMPAILAIYSETEAAAQLRLRARKQLMRLLVPALSAGVRTYLALGRERKALLTFGEIAQAGVLIFRVDGSVLDENNSLRELLSTDAERDIVRSRALRVARDIATLVMRRSSVDTLAPRASGEVRTNAARYRISGTLVESEHSSYPLIAILVQRLTPQPASAKELANRFHLTNREIQAANLIRQGFSSRQIASALGISVNTARRHAESVLWKLGAHSRAAAAARLDGKAQDESWRKPIQS